MDCRTYCAAESYDIKSLFQGFRALYNTTSYRDALHIEIPLEDSAFGNAFIFQYGALVIWGVPSKDETALLAEIKRYEIKPLEEAEREQYEYEYGTKLKFADDVITLPDRDPLTKLAISYALAQSTKLGSFEVTIQKIFNQMKDYPEDLAKYGTIKLSKIEMRKKMGLLFLERNSINLHVNVLDIPEFFWFSPEYEPLYMKAANYLDIENRVEVLNQRLNVAHELFEMLGNELNHQHSSRLEWAIIILILIEVSLALFKDVFHWL